MGLSNEILSFPSLGGLDFAIFPPSNRQLNASLGGFEFAIFQTSIGS